MDLSVYEYQGFSALGAMAKWTGDISPQDLCRPFDKKRCGFVYGQSAGCIVMESAASSGSGVKDPYAAIAGYGVALDANRSPNPSVEGERKAMEAALRQAGLTPGQIDYVNTHGTASPLGDDTEVEAMLAAGLGGVRANSTKSLIGHALSAAGLVECIACLVQGNEKFLHPGRNLCQPITDKIRWTREAEEPFSGKYLMKNSFGFGGINTSIILEML
jgi:malonyl-ACP decarboxylase